MKLILAIIFLGFILEIECKCAKNRIEFKDKLENALKDDDIEYNPDDIDINEYCEFVKEYNDRKLNKYDVDNKDELKERFKLYKQTKKNIKIWNKDAMKIVVNGKVFEEKYGITQFADMTDDEKQAMAMNFSSISSDADISDSDGLIRRLQAGWQNNHCDIAPIDKYDDVDTNTDSRSRAALCGPVKNQGQTDGCWEFATTGEAECNINHEIYSDKFIHPEHVLFNEQYVSDCTGPDQGTKAHGGREYKAVEYLSRHGLCKQNDYPYNWAQAGIRDLNFYCECNGAKYYSKCEYFDYQSDKNRLSKAAASHSWAFHMYYTDKLYSLKGPMATYSCTGKQEGGHAMTLVGQYHNDILYVKNSWGQSWGDNGYFYITPDILTNSACSVPASLGAQMSRSYGFSEYCTELTIDAYESTGVYHMIPNEEHNGYPVYKRTEPTRYLYWISTFYGWIATSLYYDNNYLALYFAYCPSKSLLDCPTQNSKGFNGVTNCKSL